MSNEMTEEEMRLVEENGCIGILEVLTEEMIAVEEVLEEIEERRKKESNRFNRTIEYFSEKIIIFSFSLKKMKIWEVYDRSTKVSSYSHIGNEYLEKTYLLSIINRGEMYGNKATNF